MYEFSRLKQGLSSDCVFLLGESMKNHTSFKIGGKADCMVQPSCMEDMKKVLDFCKKEQVPLFVMGNGSNLLVSDKGIEGVVLKISEGFSAIEQIDNTKILAQSGALISKVSYFAMDKSLSGLAFAQGIPGSVGGAVCMNAGAYGGEMAQVVTRTRYIDRNGNIGEIEGNMHNFSYRRSFFSDKDFIILDCLFSLSKGDKEEIKNQMNDYNTRRRDKQPVNWPSAGSVFKRPKGYFAGKLVDDCGLRGYSIGGAQVSEKHAGFIINKGNAAAEDVKNLVDFIKEKVKKEFNVELNCEIKMVGRM